jgi:hypothetical protein
VLRSVNQLELLPYEGVLRVQPWSGETTRPYSIAPSAESARVMRVSIVLYRFSPMLKLMSKKMPPGLNHQGQYQGKTNTIV